MPRYREQIFIYNGVRKIIRVFDQMIPEDFMFNMIKAEAAAFKMKEPATRKEYPQSAKDAIAFLDLEI